MAETVTIPRLTPWEEDRDERCAKGKPGWAPVYQLELDGVTRTKLKPHIRCNCGEWSGIGLHQVFADGRVMASFWHATAAELAGMGEAGKRFSAGCGWHVFIILADYDQGPFPPEGRPAAPDPGAPTPPAPQPSASAPIAPLIQGGTVKR